MKKNLNENVINMKKLEFESSNIKVFITHLIFVGIAYVMFLKMHFSVDSYAIIYDNLGMQYLMQGRMVTYFLNLIFNKLNINPTLNQQIFSVYLIISIAVSSTILFSIISKYLQSLKFSQWILVNISIILSFINVFLLEWFLYPEITFFLGTGLVSTVAAIYILNKGNRIINIIGSFLFLMISMGIYQANLGIFIIYSLVICLIKNKMNLNIVSLKESFIILFIGFFNSVLNVLLLKLAIVLGIAVKGDRAPSFNFEVIKTNIEGVLRVQKSIWNNAYNFLPKYSVSIFGIVLFFMLGYLLRKNKYCKKNIAYFICVIVINYLIIFAPHLFTSNLWLAQRTIVGFFMFLSSIIILVMFNCKNNNKMEKALLVISSTFLIVNYIQIHNIGINHMKSNRLDQEYASMINQEIEKYENQNNIKVKYIAAENDTKPTYNYKNIGYSIYDTNIRAFITPWANVNMINYFSGKNYIKVPMDSTIYEKYFKGKNWNEFSKDEQFIFVGDTLYLILY